MTTEAGQLGDVDYALSCASGHIRNATETLLADDNDLALLLGLRSLELQSMFGDVWPAWIPNERTASESLACAASSLVPVLDQVPLGLWAALQSLRRQVSNGHR